MPKYINKEQFEAYNKILGIFINLLPRKKDDKYYKKDLEIFRRMEVACADFELSFWQHDKEGNLIYNYDKDGEIKLNKFNADGNMRFSHHKVVIGDLIDFD